MEAMENVRSAHAFDLKLLRSFIRCLGFIAKFIRFGKYLWVKEKYNKKQFDSFYLVLTPTHRH